MPGVEERDEDRHGADAVIEQLEQNLERLQNGESVDPAALRAEVLELPEEEREVFSRYVNGRCAYYIGKADQLRADLVKEGPL